MDMPDTPMASAAPTIGLRRRLLGAGLLGLAGSLVAPFGARASATPAPTTTAPPKQPIAADVQLLAFAQTVELAAQHLYDAALATDGLGDKTRVIISAVRESHQAYAQSIASLIGSDAPQVPLAAVIESAQQSFTGSQASIVAAAFELENIVVTTHTELLGQLQGIDGAKLIASIVIIEARHAVAFGDLGGVTELDQLLLNDAVALAAEKV